MLGSIKSALKQRDRFIDVLATGIRQPSLPPVVSEKTYYSTVHPLFKRSYLAQFHNGSI